MTDVKKWLTEEEMDLYNSNPSLSTTVEFQTILESLAACRALLKKHQLRQDDIGDKYCIECGRYVIDCGENIEYDCKPDCAIATALKGCGGE